MSFEIDNAILPHWFTALSLYLSYPRELYSSSIDDTERIDEP